MPDGTRDPIDLSHTFTHRYYVCEREGGETHVHAPPEHPYTRKGVKHIHAPTHLPFHPPTHTNRYSDRRIEIDR